ncbi:hypothetical protein HUJ05_000863 [Dendroctonus ponderosae]|nr:hypothetical protein HUJ05_000863 [Dendroctonus ponderosae]
MQEDEIFNRNPTGCEPDGIKCQFSQVLRSMISRSNTSFELSPNMFNHVKVRTTRWPHLTLNANFVKIFAHDQGSVRSGIIIHKQEIVVSVKCKRLNWEQKGVIVEGERLRHLHLVDDIILLADNLGEVKDLLQDLQNRTQELGLQINCRKIKIMANMVPSDPLKFGNLCIEIVQ